MNKLQATSKVTEKKKNLQRIEYKQCWDPQFYVLKSTVCNSATKLQIS